MQTHPVLKYNSQSTRNKLIIIHWSSWFDFLLLKKKLYFLKCLFLWLGTCSIAWMKLLTYLSLSRANFKIMTIDNVEESLIFVLILIVTA